MRKGAAALRADGFDGEVKVLTSCPSCLQGLSRFDDDAGTERRLHRRRDRAQRSLGANWMADYVARRERRRHRARAGLSRRLRAATSGGRCSAVVAHRARGRSPTPDRRRACWPASRHSAFSARRRRATAARRTAATACPRPARERGDGHDAGLGQQRCAVGEPRSQRRTGAGLRVSSSAATSAGSWRSPFIAQPRCAPIRARKRPRDDGRPGSRARRAGWRQPARAAVCRPRAGALRPLPGDLEDTLIGGCRLRGATIRRRSRRIFTFSAGRPAGARRRAVGGGAGFML